MMKTLSLTEKTEYQMRKTGRIPKTRTPEVEDTTFTKKSAALDDLAMQARSKSREMSHLLVCDPSSSVVHDLQHAHAEIQVGKLRRRPWQIM